MDSNSTSDSPTGDTWVPYLCGDGDDGVWHEQLVQATHSMVTVTVAANGTNFTNSSTYGRGQHKNLSSS
jgi:hypothetical protein